MSARAAQTRASPRVPATPRAGSRAPEPHRRAAASRDLFTARLTIDVTPALRGRIKIAAFQRGITVADMLRDLLAREFPADRWRDAHERNEPAAARRAADRIAATVASPMSS